MTEQDLHVTLVLDCCFSVGVKWSGDGPSPQFRFVEYESEEELLDLQDPFLVGGLRPLRQASLNMEQLLDPNGYIVITVSKPYY